MVIFKVTQVSLNMAISRLGRYEERRQRRRLLIALGGSMAVLLFISLFGLKLLVNFSLLVDRLRGSTTAPTTTQAIILAPVLNPLPEATNGTTVNVSGTGQPGLTLILYLNEQETKKLTVPEDGNFSVPALPVKEGTNTLSAKLVDEKGNLSNLSNVVTIMVKRTPPSLDISEPPDNARVSGEDNTVRVSGKTQEDTTVTINDRLVVVQADGSFTYSYPLSEGDNTLKILATDVAGNQTIIERRVSYQK